MNNREAMQQALEALEDLHANHGITCAGTISSLRAALEQPVSDTMPPLPCPFCGERPRMTLRPDDSEATTYFAAVACYCGGYSACAHKMATATEAAEAEALARAAWNRRAAVAEPQEFVCSTGLCHYRKPLTDEQIADVFDAVQSAKSDPWYVRYARAIERAHGIEAEPVIDGYPLWSGIPPKAP